MNETGIATGAAGPDMLGAYLQIDLPRLLSWLRQGARWIALAMAAGLALGVAYTVVAPHRYTVTTEILMNPGELQIVSDDLFQQAGQPKDGQLLDVESKRQTLVSRSVLLRVIAALDLRHDPEFVPPPSLLSVSGLLGAGPTRSGDTIALENLVKRVSARRDDLSFVVTLSVTSRDSAKAIRISEAILKAFREELVTADSDRASRTADALTARIGTLKADVNAAEEAVEAFRREHGLQASQGELVSSRSMSQVNQQLVEARQRLIAAESRYRELSSGNAADAAAIQSPTVAGLRAQYATLRSQADAQSAILGPRHPKATMAQVELSALQSQIDRETQRIVAAASTELAQARSVVSSLESEAARAGSGVFSDNDAQVHLRELTREAAAKTAIYEAFLIRARQVTERQQLDTTNIRIISPPIEPKSRSWPPPTAQSGLFGALAGMVLGVFGVLGAAIAADLRGEPWSRARPAGRSARAPIAQARARPHATVGSPRSTAPARPAGALLNLWYGDQAQPPGGRRHPPRSHSREPAPRP